MRKFSPILPVLCLLAACGQSEGEQNAVELTNATDESSAEVNAAQAQVRADNGDGQPSAAAPRALTIGPLQVPYDSSLLTPVQTKVQLPPDWVTDIPATKLIGSDRAALIGKAECMYGESGQASQCNALQEAGLAFALLPSSFAEASKMFPADQRQKIEMAGVEGWTSQIGAEGEGTEYIILPAGARTILVVRHFRNTGNPDAAAQGAVLSGLKLTR